MQMSIDQGLRPTLPEDLDDEMRQLIEECWNSNPALRPAANVVALRLSQMLQKNSNSEFKTMSQGRAAEEAVKLCNSLATHLLHSKDLADDDVETKLISKSAIATAVDPITNKMLSGLSGGAAAKLVGELIYTGAGDDVTVSGAEVQKDARLDSQFYCTLHNKRNRSSLSRCSRTTSFGTARRPRLS